MTETNQVDYKELFRVLPERYVVMRTDTPKFTMVAANEAYCDITGKPLSQIIGNGMFEVFPDTSDAAKKRGRSELQISFEKVIDTLAPDHTGVIRYDIANEQGELEIRYWQATHYPVVDDDGKCVYIVQSTADVTELVESSKQMKLADLRLDDALSAGLLGSWLWNVKENIVTADKGLARIFGISAERAKKGVKLEVFLNSIYEEDREMVTKKIETALKDGTTFESEYRTVDANSEIRWVIARGRIEHDDEGEAIQFPGVMIDISARKDTESKLRASEERLRFMADSMPQLVWITRPDGYHEYYNSRWYEYTGTKVGETDGEGWNELFHPDDREHAWDLWRHSLETGDPYEVEYRLYHAESDSYRWVIGRAMPYRDESGEIIKWYGTCTDIDEHKRSEELQGFLATVSKELSSTLDTKQMLRTITDCCVPKLADWCSIDMFDKKTNSFDQISIAHMDKTKLSMVKEYRKLYPPKADAATGVAAVIRSGKSQFYPVITMEMIEKTTKDKMTLDFMKKLDLHSLVIAPLTVNGEVRGAISFASSDSGRYYTDQDLQTMNDLAARISLTLTNASLYGEANNELKRRKQLEKELRQEKKSLEARVAERTSQLRLTNEGLRDEVKKRRVVEKQLRVYGDELERSNKELEDFAYVSSHDLQEPLRKIQAFGDILRNEYAENLDDGAQYLERMQSAASRMSSLIEDLLAFSRVSTKPAVTKPIDLDEIASIVISDLEARIKRENGTVTIEGSLPTVYADQTHMRQLFQNLISNALKFHKADVKPIVTIAAHATEGGHSIVFKDNGIGIDKKYTDKIFAVFQRLNSKTAYEGTGIGLAVCKKIVERYGGTITVESNLGKGTTFTVTLPAGEPTDDAE